MDSGMELESRATQLQDMPDAIMGGIMSMAGGESRTRNRMALVCSKWRELERCSRAHLCVRGNISNLFLIPMCFQAVTHLDLSLCSPWGYPPLDPSPHGHLLAHLLKQAFPRVTSMTIYVRHARNIEMLALMWPALEEVKLVRWHRRAKEAEGVELMILLHHCTLLRALDLSHFYCWPEDVPPALLALPHVAHNLASLNLLKLSVEGFKAHELAAISQACPNLHRLYLVCEFDPRFMDYVGDDALLTLTRNCTKLRLLHLVDVNAFTDARGQGFSGEEADISRQGLQEMLRNVPNLEDLVLDVSRTVRECGGALEFLGWHCRKLKALKVGQFQGVCRGPDPEGVGVCAGLERLCIKNCADLSDQGLAGIATGCTRLANLELQGCGLITEAGLRWCATRLRKTLVEVGISCCKLLDIAATLRALEPIRETVRKLHLDCPSLQLDLPDLNHTNFDLASPSSDRAMSDCSLDLNANLECEQLYKRKCIFSSQQKHSNCGTWTNLNVLSLWIPAGEQLTTLAAVGLKSCPLLAEIKLRVEGDCRLCPKPKEAACGLSSLACYPALSKLELDCGEVIGFALSAPAGQMDLSLWERWYLNGLRDLHLSELNYWPPQDKDMNRRGISLPAVGLLSECATLRKLFIHGTASEHFMMMLLRIPNLRDVQLREDYYPAHDDDTSTEMRTESCRRFEEALASRGFSE